MDFTFLISIGHIIVSTLMERMTDQELILSMRENLEAGFRHLMTQYKEPVYWHIRRLVVSHDDAQDAAQETFLRIFRSFAQFREDCALRSWIYRIATREALRIIDKRKAEQVSIEQHLAVANTMPADSYIDYGDPLTLKLQRAILSLPTKQQLAFNMRYYDELSYEEIAEVTATSPSTVKANYHFAKEKIIKYMTTND